MTEQKGSKKISFEINSGYAGNPFVVYSFGEVLGLLKAFTAIKISNPKISAKVDYWLSKNEKLIGDAWNGYLKKELGIIQKHANVSTVDGVVYTMFQGKDKEDVLYKNDFGFFKMNDGKLEQADNPYWELEIPAKEEGGEPEKKRMHYKIQFPSDEVFELFNTELEQVQHAEKFEIDLWKLKEEYLEGIQVQWNNKGESLDEFRSLIYDNAIIQ